jgi:hypothetical protein
MRIVCLLCAARPSTPPIASHVRGSSLRQRSASSHSAVVQSRTSRQFIDAKVKTASPRGIVEVAIAARTCARRAPPSRCATKPAKNTAAPPATAGRTRIEASESPPMITFNRSSAGKSAG